MKYRDDSRAVATAGFGASAGVDEAEHQDEWDGRGSNPLSVHANPLSVHVTGELENMQTPVMIGHGISDATSIGSSMLASVIASMGVPTRERPAELEGGPTRERPAAYDARALSNQLIYEIHLHSPSVTFSLVLHIDEVLKQTFHIISRLHSSNIGQLLAAGSLQLGVNQPQDKVTAIYVAPVEVDLSDLTDKFRFALEENADYSQISRANPEGPLNAPGFRFTCKGRVVTILLAQEIQGLPAHSNSGVVPATAGLIAHEVGKTLLNSVPNLASFRQLLRFVRLWARYRGIYGHAFGFFGGTAWAVCCAYICHRSPNVELSQLVMRFFNWLSHWDTRSPVSLAGSGAEQCSKPFSRGRTSGIGPSMTPTATGVGDDKPESVVSAEKPAAEVEPPLLVELPVGEGLIATPNVSNSMARIIMKELRRGYRKLKQVELNAGHWSDVYQTFPFFQHFEHYLQFDFVASSEEVLADWLAWGMRHIGGLPHHFEATCEVPSSMRPWPEVWSFRDAEWSHARSVFVGLTLKSTLSSSKTPSATAGSKTPGATTVAPGATATADGGQPPARTKQNSYDLREPIVKLVDDINTWPEADKYADQFDLAIRHLRLADLEQWLDLCRKGLVANEKYVQEDPADASPAVACAAPQPSSSASRDASPAVAHPAPAAPSGWSQGADFMTGAAAEALATARADFEHRFRRSIQSPKQ